MGDAENNERNTDAVLDLLIHVFDIENVIKEWDVAKNTQDDLTREFYRPRIDYAIGPFNIVRNNGGGPIRDALYEYENLIDNLRINSNSPHTWELNDNPRCFIALEFENTTSQKHKMASIINASAIGLLGIIVVPTENVFKKVIRLRKYLEFLQTIGKISYAPNNVLIMTQEKLMEVLKNT